MYHLPSRVLAIMFLSSLFSYGSGPQWWTDFGVTNNGQAQNKAIATTGQGKWVAKKALEALSVIDVETADLIEDELFKATPTDPDGVFFPTPPSPKTSAWRQKQKEPLQVGALKALAKPFYENLNIKDSSWVKSQLELNGFTVLGVDYFQDAFGHFYPWNPANDTDTSINLAPVTLGQLKAVFSIDVQSPVLLSGITLAGVDSDGDGIPDLFETGFFGFPGTGTDPNNADSDGDGASDYVESIVEGTDPNDANSNPGFLLTITKPEGAFEYRLNRFLEITATKVPGGGLVGGGSWPVSLGEKSELTTYTIHFKRFRSIDSPKTLDLLNVKDHGAQSFEMPRLVIEPLRLTIPANQTSIGQAISFDNSPLEFSGNQWYLEPIELRVRQNVGHTGPWGSKSLYEVPKPLNGDIIGEVFSLWNTEEAYVTVGGSIATLIGSGDMEEDAVVWSAPDHTDVKDTSEFRVEWTTFGNKEVEFEFSGTTYLIHFAVPDVGSIGRTNPFLVQYIGLVDLHYIWQAGTSAKQAVDAKYGTTPSTGGTRQDAIRHSTWNAVVANRLGIARTKAATTANEYTGKHSANAIASNTVMDLHNNHTGALFGDLLLATGKVIPANQSVTYFIGQMERYYDNGNHLLKWIRDTDTVESHYGMLRWSDDRRLFHN